MEKNQHEAKAPDTDTDEEGKNCKLCGQDWIVIEPRPGIFYRVKKSWLGPYAD